MELFWKYVIAYEEWNHNYPLAGGHATTGLTGVTERLKWTELGVRSPVNASPP